MSSREIFAALFVGTLAVLVVVVLYLGGWWVTKDSTDRSDQVNRSSYGFQQAQRQQLSNQITAVGSITSQLSDPAVANDQANALHAQRRAVLTQACQTATQITNPLPDDQAAWVGANCAAGAPNPSSTLAN
jgi:glycerol kinase